MEKNKIVKRAKTETKIDIKPSSAVLGFCMVMLMNGNNDGFYISTISLILGGVMGSNTTTEKKNDNNNNNKKKN